MTTLLLSVQQDLDVIGVRGLHELLRARGEDSTLVFMPALKVKEAETIGAFEAFVREKSPSLVGISLMSMEYDAAVLVTRMLRDRFPELPVVWGGIHPTCDPESCFDAVDWICVGEGENTMLDLVRAAKEGRSFKDIPNMGWREDGVYRQNDLYPLIHDLDSLPPLTRLPENTFVALSGGVRPLDEALFRKYARYGGKNYATISSRGCPYECAFCCNSQFRRLYPDWKVRRRSVEHLIGELRAVLDRRPDIAYFNLHDDCFLACPLDHLRRFCEAYKKTIGRPFIARTAPAYVTPERLSLLKEAGLAWISVGLQSGSDRVCREVYCRRSTQEQFLAAARLIHEFKIAAFYDFIFDNPWESREETLETVSAIMAIPRPFHAELFSLVFYRGTTLRERAEKEGIPIREDPNQKDFFILHRRRVNDLAETAVNFPLMLMRPLLERFRKHPDSFWTGFALSAAKWSCGLFFNPIAYFRLIRMSQGGSLIKTIAVLPNYLRAAFWKYYLAMFMHKRIED